MLRILVGRARAAKRRLTEEIRAALDRGGEHSLILLVPEEFTLSSELTLIDDLDLPGSFRILVVSPARLCSLIFEEAGRPEGARIDDRGRVMALYAALVASSRELTEFRGHQRSFRFAATALEQLVELKRAGLDRTALGSIAEDTEDPKLRATLRDLTAIWAAYDEALGGRYLDAEDELGEALSRAGAAEFLKGAEVWAYGFEAISPTLARIALAILPQASDLAVVLVAKGLSAAPHEAHRPVIDGALRFSSLARDGGFDPRWFPIPERGDDGQPAEIAWLERELFGVPPKPYPKRPSAVRSVRLKNPLEEAMFAAAFVRRMAMERGWRWRDVAVGYRYPSAYAEPLERAFSLYGIPLFIEGGRPAGIHPAARCLVSAIRFATGGHRAEEAIRLIRTGYAGLDADGCDRLTNYAVEWGLQGGRWKEPIARGKEGEIAYVEPLRARLMGPIDRLEAALRGEGGVAAQLEGLWRMMEEFGARETLEAEIERLREFGFLIEANESAQIWNRIVGTFEQMRDIVGERKLPPRELADMLEQSLMASQVKPLPQSMDAVEAGRLSRLRGYPVRAILLLGMGDAAVEERAGLLNAAERETLARRYELWFPPSAADRASLFAMDILGALSLSKELVVFTYPGSDAEGEYLPSGSVIERVGEVFPELRGGGGLSVGEGLSSMLLNAPNAALSRIGPALRGSGGDGPARRAYAALLASDAHRGQAEALAEALSDRFGARGLSAETARRLYRGDSAVSVSRLERYAACPFMHFVGDGLRPAPLPTGEFTPQGDGVFVHDALEAFFTEVGDGPPPAAEDARNRMGAVCDALLAPMLEGPFGDHPMLLARCGRLRNVACRAAEVLSRQFEGSLFVPCAFEASLSDIAPDFLSGDGFYRLSGRIDRIDRYVDGEDRWVRVIDYKTGSVALSLPRIYFGLQLQLMVYLAAALDWEGGRPAGVFYFRAADPLVDTFDTEPAAVDALRDKALRLQGMVIRDASVALAMSPEPERALRLSFNKDGTFSMSSRAYTEFEFRAVLARALSEAKGIAEGILSGNAAILPANEGGVKPCERCDYAAICRIDPTVPGGEGRRIPKLSGEEALARMVAAAESGETINGTKGGDAL